MLPFRWGTICGLLLLIVHTNGAVLGTANEYDNDSETIDELDITQRMKRSGRGYLRGQTQSQYLNFGQPEKAGEAEAEASSSGSRAKVSGTQGMGQAQSQFSSGDCGDCAGVQPAYDYTTGGVSYPGGAGAPLGIGRPEGIISLPGGPGVVVGGGPQAIGAVRQPGPGETLIGIGAQQGPSAASQLGETVGGPPPSGGLQYPDQRGVNGRQQPSGAGVIVQPTGVGGQPPMPGRNGFHIGAGGPPSGVGVQPTGRGVSPAWQQGPAGTGGIGAGRLPSDGGVSVGRQQLPTGVISRPGYGPGTGTLPSGGGILPSEQQPSAGIGAQPSIGTGVPGQPIYGVGGQLGGSVRPVGQQVLAGGGAQPEPSYGTGVSTLPSGTAQQISGAARAQPSYPATQPSYGIESQPGGIRPAIVGGQPSYGIGTGALPTGVQPSYGIGAGGQPSFGVGGTPLQVAGGIGGAGAPLGYDVGAAGQPSYGIGGGLLPSAGGILPGGQQLPGRAGTQPSFGTGPAGQPSYGISGGPFQGVGGISPVGQQLTAGAGGQPSFGTGTAERPGDVGVALLPSGGGISPGGQQITAGAGAPPGFGVGAGVQPSYGVGGGPLAGAGIGEAQPSLTTGISGQPSYAIGVGPLPSGGGISPGAQQLPAGAGVRPIAAGRQPSRQLLPSGQPAYPSGVGGQLVGPAAGGQQRPGELTYPSGGISYPVSETGIQQIPSYPGVGAQQGAYPISGTGQQPAGLLGPIGAGTTGGLQPVGQYAPVGTGAGGLQVGYGYPPGVAGGPGTGIGVVGAGVDGADDAFSQAESTIGDGQAAASSQGRKNGGTAKTQVSGSYSSGGTFSASAMTSDSDRAASAQVTGNQDGALSQSQGSGGAAQSQAQVQLNSRDGGTKASSQSGGVTHSSQSEVQANDKGGLADAQSSGPGQTSSQAQIGFRPGQENVAGNTQGGGQASAQSGSFSGQSQSQIYGKSSFGVSYHGAAQSASGTKEQVATYREQNRELFNTISQFGSNDAVTDHVDTVYSGSALTSESDAIPELQLKSTKTNKEVDAIGNNSNNSNNNNKNKNKNKVISEDTDVPGEEEEDEEEPYDEYDDEEYYYEKPIKLEDKLSLNNIASQTKKDDSKPNAATTHTYTQKSPTQAQQATISNLSTDKYTVVQNQNGRINRYPIRTTTESVPNGFRGTVNVETKYHTKALESHPNPENKVNINDDKTTTPAKPRAPDSYVTVTKSVTGSMDNSKNPPQDSKNFQSTYYTKSSTCGYFTFSCNIVYGSNGRSKICRPKAPTNGKC